MAVIGVGAIGAHHARNLASRVPGARLAGVADPMPDAAQEIAAALGGVRWSLDYEDLLSDDSVEAVVVATPARFHADAIVAAAQAGKAVFCEKPISHELAEADRAIEAAHAAGVPLQIGFQRRFDRSFRRAHEIVASGQIGQVQMLRSLTRDPALDRPERVTPWAVFLETLVHDFDVLRFFAAGAEPVEIFAMADALILPDWKPRGMLDTAMATLRFDSGAFASVDASFQAVYGYDVRAEVFGSEGMITVGERSPINMVHHRREGAVNPRPRWFVDLFGDAYVAELSHFVACVRNGATPDCTGEDGRAALRIARAAVESVESGQPVRL
ncbi:MAG: Gfo/Idh/MocA family oxidoreductase [Chloroflexota bacterium]|nr:Gfo/Idh/MocA family oxidoreductase [Chloroflexota bacterium]